MNELLAFLGGLFSLAVWCALVLSKRLDGDDEGRRRKTSATSAKPPPSCASGKPTTEAAKPL